MDEFQRKLHERIGEKKERLNSLLAKRDELNQEIKDLEDAVARYDAVLQLENPQPLIRKEFVGLTVAKASAVVLLRAGQPLHISKLWEALDQGGISLSSKEPLNVVNSILNQYSSFQNIGNRTWSLLNEDAKDWAQKIEQSLQNR